MKFIVPIFLTIAISVSFVSLGMAQPDSSIAKSDNQFAFDLYSRLASNSGNIFFSPYSLSSALEMTYEGARGQTAQEMHNVLHLGADDAARRAEISEFIQEFNANTSTYEFSVANALWAQKDYPFKADYLNLVKNIYFAQARNLDFKSDPEASRLTINSWVSDKTQDRINDLLPAGSITPITRMVLTNAIYFKSSWAIPFKRENTKPDTFWLNPDHSLQTDMMRSSGETFWYMENDQAQLLQLSYKRNDLAMIVILPRSKEIQGLEKDLTPDMLTKWQESMTRQKVDVFFPKFKFDSYYKMGSILSEMGMKLAFDQHQADFSGMADRGINENLYIGDVFHKAWIATDETGTEAAAATATVMLKSLAMRVDPQEPKIFRADHPFLFVIQENRTGHILFMGRVSDPREK